MGRETTVLLVNSASGSPSRLALNRRRSQAGQVVRRHVRWTLVCSLLLVAPLVVSAQFRGLGRIGGTVTDEAGAPIAGVNVKATTGTGSLDFTSDEKGAWLVSGVARGEWHVEFVKAGYTPKAVKVVLKDELTRIPPIAIALRKAS